MITHESENDMTERHELITPEELAGLEEIDRLLDEAYRHYFARPDALGKSAEGHIEVILGNYWDRDADEERTSPRVAIYSYALGPSRTHYFNSVQEALDEVQAWRAREMEKS